MVRACQKPCFVTMGRRPRRGRLPIVPSGVPVVSRVRFVLPPSSASHAVGNGIPARRGDGRDGGGWGIRTPEGLHPTRFPSVRHRPLGESSVHIVPDNHKRKMSSRANPGQWSRSQAVISRKKGSHGAQTHRAPNSRASKLRQCDTHRRTHRRGDGTRAGRPGLVD